ncbi:MAG: ribosome maturation factor RimM [Caldimonas sp.]
MRAVAADTSSEWPVDALEVGRIGEAWGLKGGFRVLPYADPPEALRGARRWHLQAPSDRVHVADGAPQLPPSIVISGVRSQGDGYVAMSPDVADRTAAEALRGARIFVPRSSFPAVGVDEYYWTDLIGLAVRNRDDAELGEVVGLMDTGAHSVLRVQPADGKEAERLIPFVAAFIDSVDLSTRRIVVDWGLDY